MNIFLVVLSVLVVIAFISFLVIWMSYEKIERDWIKRDNEWWNNSKVRN